MIEKLRGLRLTKAAELVAAAVEETLVYYAFPEEHWRRIRTIDKRFFVNCATNPFFCSAAPQLILPSRPSISQPPRAGAVKATRFSYLLPCSSWWAFAASSA